MIIGVTNDIHLDLIARTESRTPKIIRVAKELTRNCDHLLICGDISVSSKLKWHMEAFDEGAQCPYHWVIGNHDYWGSSFNVVDNDIECMKGYVHNKIVELKEDTCIVGINGWFDGRTGDVQNLWDTNDHLKIANLYSVLHKSQRDSMYAVRSRADQQAELAVNRLEEAVKKYSTIFVVTHYPPWHNSEDDSKYYAWSVNTVLGTKILNIAANNPKVKFEVFAGHTHQEWSALISDNVNIKTQKAIYKEPLTRYRFEI